jgi:hypothetical protein
MLPGVWYTVSFVQGSALPKLPAELPRPAQPQGWYILAAGHNVSPPFLSTWLRLGGVTGPGAPLAEAQAARQGTVQYFQNIEMRAQSGAAALLPLGLDALGGQPAPAARELPKKQRHLFFAATGHNLRAAFLNYWQATGGAAIWGPPISEEQSRGGVSVQYFTNAEFVWNGAAVTLAPLGAKAWAQSSTE